MVLYIPLFLYYMYHYYGTIFTIFMELDLKLLLYDFYECYSTSIVLILYFWYHFNGCISTLMVNVLFIIVWKICLPLYFYFTLSIFQVNIWSWTFKWTYEAQHSTEHSSKHKKLNIHVNIWSWTFIWTNEAEHSNEHMKLNIQVNIWS